MSATIIAGSPGTYEAEGSPTRRRVYPENVMEVTRRYMVIPATSTPITLPAIGSQTGDGIVVDTADEGASGGIRTTA